MKEHFLEFMKKVFENKHQNERNIKKGVAYLYSEFIILKNQIKLEWFLIVPSAKHDGVSLKDLRSDLNNTLLGVLMHFRRENIAITAAVQQMFYSFVIWEDHLNYLQFLWYEDNNLSNHITEFRMKMHIFGNRSSPSVAIYGLKRAAQEHQEDY